MKALVTGSSGFVGRHISQELMHRGYLVHGIDTVRPTREGDVHIFWQDTLSRVLDWNDYQYDLVVHCAYEVGGRTHIDGKNLALAHNLEMDALLFDWAVRTEQKAVLYFSSCAAYPAHYQQTYCDYCDDAIGWEGPYRATEDMISFDGGHYSDCGPFDNYGWAKRTGERLGRAASDLGLRVHTVRPFSGYGADQSLDYPFPSIVRRAHQGDLSVWGPPGQFRDWIHISDIVDGSLAVYEADYRGPVNLCTGVATEFGKFAQTAALLAGTLSGPVVYDPSKPTGSLYRVGDPTLMNQFYTAKISLEEGIREALGRL